MRGGGRGGPRGGGRGGGRGSRNGVGGGGGGPIRTRPLNMGYNSYERPDYQDYR